MYSARSIQVAVGTKAIETRVSPERTPAETRPIRAVGASRISHARTAARRAAAHPSEVRDPTGDWLLINDDRHAVWKVVSDPDCYPQFMPQVERWETPEFWCRGRATAEVIDDGEKLQGRICRAKIGPNFWTGCSSTPNSAILERPDQQKR